MQDAPICTEQYRKRQAAMQIPQRTRQLYAPAYRFVYGLKGNATSQDMINVSDKLNRAAALWLRAERVRQGKTQEELGDDSGVGQSAVSKAERLGPKEIGLHRFLAIAKVLGFTSRAIEDLPIAD